MMNYGISCYKAMNKIQEEIGRIIRIDKYIYRMVLENNEIVEAQLNTNASDVCYVGDYVTYAYMDGYYYITRIMPRKTVVSKAANRTSKSLRFQLDEQILAVNVDQIFIIMASDQRFTISKFERYLLTFTQDNLDIRVIISKADFTEKAEYVKKEIEYYYPELECIQYSIYDNESLDRIGTLIRDDQTFVLLGSSGAGKSTLINALLDKPTELVGNTRRDGKGRHTTTYTTLIPLPNLNAYVVDTPGFKGIDTTREVEGSVLYEDILELAKQCKFKNCHHLTEPGCAVKQAVENNEISEAKYQRYLVNQKKIAGYQRHEAMKKHLKNKQEKRRMKEI